MLVLGLDLGVTERFSAYDIYGVVAFLWYWISSFGFKILWPSGPHPPSSCHARVIEEVRLLSRYSD